MEKRTRNQMRRTNKARKFPTNTCPASRHVHMIAEALAKGKKYHLLEEEPEHCAGSLLSVLESLWTLRTKTGWPDEREKAKQARRLNKALRQREAESECR